MKENGTLAFPTPLHEQVACAVVDFFRSRDEPHTALVIASCARGNASAASDLDMVVLVSPECSRSARDELISAWESFRDRDPLIHRAITSNELPALHLDVADGTYRPTVWDDGGGPDAFEVEIGNHLAYSVPLWERGADFQHLRATWLPYYDESLRVERREMAHDACVRDLETIPSYVERDLNFQAFDRLYKAHQEFLQALFISRRVYPIAYNKWIREQVVDLLSAPELHSRLSAVLQVRDLERSGLLSNAAMLTDLVREWLPA